MKELDTVTALISVKDRISQAKEYHELLKSAHLKTEKNLIELELECADLERSLQADLALSGDEIARILNVCSLQSHQLLTDTFKLYQCAATPQTNCDTLSYDEAQRLLWMKSGKDIVGIYSCFFDDRLYVKTPLPPHQFRRWENAIAKKNMDIVKENTTIFLGNPLFVPFVTKAVLTKQTSLFFAKNISLICLSFQRTHIS